MKKINFKIFVVVFWFLAFSTSHAEPKITVSVIVSGTLESIIYNERAVIFDGKKYKYRISDSQSVLKNDETEPEALGLLVLKVGESYFFEKVSYNKMDDEPTDDDYQDIIFITKVKPNILNEE